MALTTGTRLGRYEILAQLGAGGMGEVYLAQDTKLDRKVALKILPADVAADRNRMSRFVQEAKAASALNHPNIITIHEIEQIDSVNFIATEFIDGETLRHRMRNVSMKLSEVLDVAAQVASALSAAHAAGIVHRDIKPENVMLRRDGIVKVLDFGLAKLTGQAVGTSVDTEAPTRGLINTEPGVVMGTAIYMSPEQARGLPVDARTDIWSLGVLLYEMVAGCLPFEGSTTSEMLASILNEKEPPPLARYSREAPAELERIVSKALRKEREQRYQTTKDLLLDLQSLKQQLEFEAKLERSVPPEQRFSRAGAAQAASESAPATAAVSAARAASSAEYFVSQITNHKRGVALGSILMLALIGFGYWFFFNRSSGSTDAIDSIAVLPFQNKSSDADTEYLSDGLAESLIYRLSQLPNLKVSPTSSVFRYKGKETEPIKIGNELGVNAVMSGRIVQRGESLTISVELVDVRNNKLLWGEQYDRKISDLLATQREIAREIVDKLRLQITGNEKALTKHYTESNEAYQLYWKGRFYWNKRTEEGLKRGIEYFNQAIEKDPNFALAYAGIADCYSRLAFHGYLAPRDGYGKAKTAAQTAMKLDDTLAEGHTSLAYVLFYLDWNWQAAEKEFQRAIELNPKYPTAHQAYAAILSPMGRHDEAKRESEIAQELDPLSLIVNATAARVFIWAGEYEQAIAQSQKNMEIDRSFFFEQTTLGISYSHLGKYDQAIAILQEVVKQNPESVDGIGRLGGVYARAGKRSEAERVLKQLQEMSSRRYVPHVYSAHIYAELGDHDEAFRLLDRAYDDRETWICYLKVDDMFAKLHSDPRFKDMLKRLNLPE